MKRIPLRRGDVFAYDGKRYEYVCRWKNNVGAPVYVVKDLSTDRERYWNVVHLKSALEQGTAVKA